MKHRIVYRGEGGHFAKRDGRKTQRLEVYDDKWKVVGSKAGKWTGEKASRAVGRIVRQGKVKAARVKVAPAAPPEYPPEFEPEPEEEWEPTEPEDVYP